MGDNTGIEWTDATWNPTVGCSVISPGCTNCYAMKMAARIEAMAIGQTTKNGAPGLAPTHYAGTTQPSKAGPVWTGKLALAPQDVLLKPLRWKRPRMIFVNSMSDLFHEDVPNDWINNVFAVMTLCPQHTFQVLTKRADRMREYLSAAHRAGSIDSATWSLLGTPTGSKVHHGGKWECTLPLPNVWLGISAEDQKRADERIPHLMETPAAVRFVSAEPLLGPISFEEAWHGETALDPECWGDCSWCKNGHPPLYNCKNHPENPDFQKGRSGLDWIIVGGESGPGARPMHPDWARSIRDQCQAAGVPFFFKQHGEWAPCPDASDWLYDPDYYRTTWFDEPYCVRPVEEGWSDKYYTGHCRAQDPILLKPYGGELFGTPEFLDQVKRCPQGKCGEAGKCLGNDRRQAVRRIGKRAAGRLLDGQEYNEMPERTS